MKNVRLKNVLSLCLMVLLLVVYFIPAVNAAVEMVITPVKQAKTNWCWAASAEMAATWIYPNVSGRTQYDIVKYLKGNMFDQYPNVSGTLDDGVSASQYICHNEKEHVFKTTATLLFSEIKKHIDSSYPIQAAIGYYNGTERTGGHRIVINGLSSTDNSVKYTDPWDTTTQWVTFSTFKNGLLGSGSKYDGTVYYDGPFSIVISGEKNIIKNDIVEIPMLKSNNYTMEKNHTGMVTIDLLKFPINNIDGFEYLFLSKDNDSIKNTLNNSEASILKYTDEIAKNILINNAFKLYDINSDLIESYKNNIPVEKIISDSYQWYVPVSNINNEISHFISLKKQDNNWIVSSIGECVNKEDVVIDYNFDTIYKVLSNLGFKNVQNFKFLRIGQYHISLLYFTQDGKEYALPFNSRPDLIDLNNEKVYEMKDIVDVLDKSFNQ